MSERTPNPRKAFTEEDIRRLIFQRLDEPPDMIELQKAIIQWAVDLLEAGAGEIFLWDPSRQVLVLTLPIGYTKGYTDRFEGVELKPGEGLAGKAFQSLQPMIVKDYYLWEGRAPIFTTDDEFGLHSVLAVPMVWESQPIGVLTINASIHQKTFTDRDIRLATLFSNIAAISIMNARLYGLLQLQTRTIQNALQQEVEARTAELENHNARLNLSAQVSREITSIFDLDRLLNQVVNRISGAFGYYCVLIFLVDSTRQSLQLRAASGVAGEALLQSGMSIPIDEASLNGLAARTTRLVIASDSDLAPGLRRDERLPLTRSEIVFPLQVGEQLLGTLDVQSSHSETFSGQQVLVLQSLADQVAIAIQNSRFHERSKEVAVLEERNRLARELHDSVTQSLFSLDLHARAAATYIDKDLHKAREQLQELRQTTHDTLQDMRSLIYDLRPISIHEIGLAQALQEQAERFTQPNCVIAVECSGLPGLPDALENGLFRIAQEALRNALKHAGASQIRVRLECMPGRAVLLVEDNGCGFDPEQAAGKRQSFGLIGMRERAELLQGTFRVDTSFGSGTRVWVELPI